MPPLRGREGGKKLFEPKELKSIEIDIAKRIFNINGERMNHCTGFHLDCDVGRDDRYHLHIISTVEPEFFGAFDSCGVQVNKYETKKCECRGCGKRWHLQDAKFCVDCGKKLVEPKKIRLSQ